MKNRLIDIHNILMATLEDLDDQELLEDPERMKRLIEVAKTKSQVANTIVKVDSLGLKALQKDCRGIDIAEPLKLEEK